MVATLNKINKPIVLLGMMGVGKTTFGRKLANVLKVPFYDLDQEIEADIGHSVSWIFENAGEAEFRKLEAEKLKQLLSQNQPIVLALGGGAFIPEGNRDLIKKLAISVWLRAKAETIHTRVSYRKDRPLLEKVKDKMAYIKELIEERDPYYSQSDVHVWTDNATHRAIVDSMAHKVGKELES